MTSVRLTHRHVLSNEFMVSNMNYLQMEVERSDDPILFEVLDYKTNATHSDITILAGEDNFPMMTEDNYGKAACSSSTCRKTLPIFTSCLRVSSARSTST